MKVSLNWVKEYVDVTLPIDELVAKIGAQLGAVEEVINLGKKYQGIVVVKVVSCEPHPDADKLKVCLLDDNGAVKDVERNKDGFVQIVCGGANVRDGLLSAWIPPGSIVPSTFDKDPLKMEAREIRGVMSYGMLGTGREVAINDDHSGVLEISPNATLRKKDESVDSGDHVAAITNTESVPAIKPGDDFAKTYKLDDYIIDIENKMFTHRPDCFGILGVAREIAGITGQKFTSPGVYLHSPTKVDDDKSLPLEARNEVPELAPRFMAQIYQDITIGPSDLTIQATLQKIGIRPINNIVDITNYMMYLTGQPMHAFDYHKIKDRSGDTPVLGPRLASGGEELTLLGGKKLKLTKDDIVLATDKQPVDLAGVMGGADTEIDNNTTAIIITCASFDMYAIRRATMRHGVFTDAATRYTKGQSPLQNDRVLAWAQGDIICQAGGTPDDHVYDIHAGLPELSTVEVSTEFINARLGLKLTAEEIKKLLENVEFEVSVDDESLLVTAPFWRTDIAIPEDIVEEVGRLYGYDHLPLELPRRDLTPAPKDPLLELKSQLRTALAKAGANEVLTYSFVHGDLLGRVGQDTDQAFRLANALSPDLHYFRLSLTPSLLDKVHPNIKAGHDQFALFEINKTHDKSQLDSDGLPVEEERIALVFAAEDKYAKRNYQGAAYYQARKYLTTLLEGLGIQPVFDPSTTHDPRSITGQQGFAPFEKTRSSYVKTSDGHNLGFLGEYNSSVRHDLKLPDFVAGFELDVSELMKARAITSPYQPLSKYPSVQQDISLKVPATTSFGELEEVVQAALGAEKPEHSITELTPLDIYQNESDQDHKQVAFRLTIASYDRTLTAEEVNALLDKVAASAKEKLAAERL